jgi:hypothetical protein
VLLSRNDTRDPDPTSLGATSRAVARAAPPCFHTVRIELARDNLDDPLVVGLPSNQPRGPDRTGIPVLCAGYEPTVMR